MARISADNVLFTFGMFAIIMLAYGSSFQEANVQASMSQIFASWPSFQQTVTSLSGPAKTCGNLDFGCQASAGIAQATAYIGAAIAYPGVLAGSALSRISGFGNVLGLVTFGPASALATIPFGLLFFAALILVVVIEAFRLFRGSPSGL